MSHSDLYTVRDKIVAQGVSSRVRLVDIRGGLLERGANGSGVVVNGDFRLFRSLYLPIQGHNYYIVLIVALH